MEMSIFGRNADFDQLALGTNVPENVMTLLGGKWSRDTVSSIAKIPGWGEYDMQFNLFYNYEQFIPFKELELIQFTSLHNFHTQANKDISPLGLYAPSLYQRLRRYDTGSCFISHIGIHCTEEEGESWRRHFSTYGIDVAHEDTSYAHTNPVIAGKRNYHNIIFGSREAIGFDFKACIRINVNE